MKTNKRFWALLLAVLVAVAVLPLRVAAEETTPAGLRLCISCREEGVPLTGAPFRLYLVAAVNAYGELETTEAFRPYRVDMTGESDERALAATLEGFVLRDGVAPLAEKKTDANGIAAFTREDGLVQGLYLVVGDVHTQNGLVYEPTPFMVRLPYQNAETGQWEYDVVACPKMTSRPVDGEPVTRKVLKVWDDENGEKQRPAQVEVLLLKDGRVADTVVLNQANNWRYTWEGLDSNCKWTVVEKDPGNYMVSVSREGVTFVVTNTYTGGGENESPELPRLPQSGQLWWPVPVLLAGGLLLVVVGLLRRRSGNEK